MFEFLMNVSIFNVFSVALVGIIAIAFTGELIYQKIRKGGYRVPLDNPVTNENQDKQEWKMAA